MSTVPPGVVAELARLVGSLQPWQRAELAGRLLALEARLPGATIDADGSTPAVLRLPNAPGGDGKPCSRADSCSAPCWGSIPGCPWSP